ncbi:anaphase-promoting complex subunit 10-like [Palaemon carinicauda]|uniref:anaphase-promoting complex subunit 10-like n=1 Tax=Palaemon carinicauda TaxID=392227 RepID=UPI0035B6184D
MGRLDVGKDAVWSVSSSQEGFGVEELMDPSPDTYWKSCGALPHLITLQFKKRTTLDDLSVYLDHEVDRISIPTRLSIRCGRDLNHLQEIKVVNLSNPCGLVSVPLYEADGKFIRGKVLQLAVLEILGTSSYAKICHVKVYSPPENIGDALE